jgi:DNA-binding beta-propeller fold protein YncE
MRFLAAASIIGSMLAALLTGGGCGPGLFPEITPTTSVTATPVTNAFLYATNFNDGTVSAFKRNTNTGALTFIAKQSAGALSGPDGVAVRPQNDFTYVANASDGHVYEYTIEATGNLAPVGNISSGATAQLVAIDDSGNFVYVTNAGARTVSEYQINTSTGTLTSVDTLTGFTGQPFGIVTYPSAEVAYVGDNTAGVIYSLAIAANGSLSEISQIDSNGTTPGNPGELAIDPAGQFLFSDDTVAGTVSVFTIQSDGSLVFNEFFGTGGAKPVGIAAVNGNANTANEYVFTANVTGSFVLPFLRSGATLTQQTGITDNSAPTGLAIDPEGLFAYTGNSGNGTIGLIGIASSQCSGNGNCLIHTFPSEENPTNSSAGTQYVATTH